MATTCKLFLYSTAACHLCEQAAALLQPYLQRGWRCEEVDIAADDALFERYGVRIPVLLRTDTGAELGWPFDAPTLLRFVEMNLASR